MADITLFDDGGFDGPRLDIDGFQGPLDLLLHLTQKGKVDIRQVSTSSIAEQFLSFVRNRDAERLENVADWLVMAATLVWIKSRLLLPVRDKERRQAEALIETLAEKLQRLEAIRDLVARMGSGLILGEDWFPVIANVDGETQGRRSGATMRLLLAMYAKEASEPPPPPSPIKIPHRFVSIDEALRHVMRQLDAGIALDFLEAIPAPRHQGDVYRRSAVCSTFVAFLELARQGRGNLVLDDEGRLTGLQPGTAE